MKYVIFSMVNTSKDIIEKYKNLIQGPSTILKLEPIITVTMILKPKNKLEEYLSNQIRYYVNSSDKYKFSKGIIPLDVLNATQTKVNSKYVKEYFRLPKERVPPIVVFKLKDKFYIQDGHHRALAAILRGDKTIKANIVRI